jgi:glyoxylase-like metal-dependent hydrolase (beta-lactamase superfamily II)
MAIPRGKGLIALLLLVLAALAVTVAVPQRYMIWYEAWDPAAPPPLLDQVDEGPGVRWHDDYFTVEALDERTFAIGEPRYYQRNYNYLLLGTERAVLFDAGPGVRDIRPVAQALTDLPVTFVPSHFHVDHVGNEITFEKVAVIDLPYLRARAPDNRLQLTDREHLGFHEDVAPPTLEVDEWIAAGDTMQLGDRSLRVLYTPGHTEDSISLLDLDSGQLFSGDFIYPGPLYAYLPNSGMGDYVQAADTVLNSAPAGVRIHGAHRGRSPGAPRLTLADIQDLRVALDAIRSGELSGDGFYPVRYRINSRLRLLADPWWLQNWTPRHPSLATR